MAAVPSFHFNVEAKLAITSEGVTLDIPINLVGDFQAPDRIQGTLALSIVFFQIESEFINIGDTSYATDPDTGEWMAGQRQALDFVDPAVFASPEFLVEGGRLAELVLVGSEILAGTPVYQLSGQLSDEEGPETLEVSFRIGVDDGLIYQVKLSGQFKRDEELGIASTLRAIGAGDPTFDALLTFSDFGKPVAIEAPEITSGAPDGPGVRVAEMGASHVVPGEDHPPYNSVPATSGPHFGHPLAPVRWGVYDSSLADEVLVHNLEHGYVNVHYDCPDGCPELVQQLTDIVDKAADRGGKVLMSPYPDMDARIALTAWTFIDRFDEFDEKRISEFVNSHESSPNAPEATVPR
jgi:hypothetical protein